MINIHNMMEEQVISRVNQLYDQVRERGSDWLTYDCENCRLDTISYVLNRIPPRYVVSGRGVTHYTNDMSDLQVSVDIDKLGIEGMRLVSAAKRPYHNACSKNASDMPEVHKPVFNFPTFIGNVFDGSSFEPLANASILLKLEGKNAEMMDVTWPNPCNTYTATQGSYTFRVSPEITETQGETRCFNFALEITCPGYDSINYSFEVPLKSELTDRREFNSVYTLKIQDLFLFKEGTINDQE